MSAQPNVRLGRAGLLQLFAVALVLHPPTAPAQRSATTFGGIPLWADSALRVAGLGAQFRLSSSLNPVYGFGDFDRDGLDDVAVEIKDTGGLRCGVAIVHQLDRSVHIVGAGQPVGNGEDQVRCLDGWSVVAATRGHRHRTLGAARLYITGRRGHSGWISWDGRSYAWTPES